jgi:hypothetical protein
MAAIASIDPTIDWLMTASEPVVRYRALVDLLGVPHDDSRATNLAHSIADGPIVSALMSGQEADGGFGRHPYSKWTGGHWRLVSLMDLGVPADLDGARAAIEPVFRWLTGKAHRGNVPVIAGLARRCASQEGNALAVAVHFGMAGDARSRLLAESLAAGSGPTAAGTATGERRRTIPRSTNPCPRCAAWPPMDARRANDGPSTRRTARPSSSSGTVSCSRSGRASRSDHARC